jgi:hypothetical protein
MSGYIIYVEQILLKETERVQECLDISTKRKLIFILQKELITKHEKELLMNEEFSKLIAD